MPSLPAGSYPSLGHPQPCPWDGWVHFRGGIQTSRQGTTVMLEEEEEDAEAEEEGLQQTLPREVGNGPGEGLAAQQGFIQAVVQGTYGPGPVAHVCLQGGDWNSLK